MNKIWLLNLDSVPYADALKLQHRVVDARKRGELGDLLILLEHPPVFTLGRNAVDSNILASDDLLKDMGIQVFRVERGGDVTYHGPNQLVGYPILNLRNFRQDVGWYVRCLEETLIRTLGDFGIQGHRVEKLVGVWVDCSTPKTLSLPPIGEEAQGERGEVAKIAQIGARIENWITYHGFALNVDPNMIHFDLIVPCGITDKAVTSMARILNRPVAMNEVRQHIAKRFAEVFGAELVQVSRSELEEKLSELAETPAIAD